MREVSDLEPQGLHTLTQIYLPLGPIYAFAQIKSEPAIICTHSGYFAWGNAGLTVLHVKVVTC